VSDTAPGGFVTPSAGTSPEAFVSQWRADKKVSSPRYRFGFGYGSDMNGLGDQSAPTSRTPIAYPFRSFAGRVAFGRERWGERVFDMNRDGVANYGLHADWLQELRVLGGRPLMSDLFRGSEAYLETWERAYGVPAGRCRPAGERLTSAGLGRSLLLGATSPRVLLRAGQPSARPGRSFRHCVSDGGRAAAVVAAGGRVALVSSTACGARAARVGPGASATRLRGRAVPAGFGVLMGRSAGGVLYGVRAGRVRWVAVASGSEAANPRRLVTDLRAAGLS